MSETGLVAVFTGVRKPFAFLEFPVPEPAPGGILVKVRMANVCGSMGADINDVRKIVDRLIEEGFSISNIAFGMGGGLLQKCNRRGCALRRVRLAEMLVASARQHDKEKVHVALREARAL